MTCTVFSGSYDNLSRGNRNCFLVWNGGFSESSAQYHEIGWNGKRSAQAKCTASNCYCDVEWTVSESRSAQQMLLWHGVDCFLSRAHHICFFGVGSWTILSWPRNSICNKKTTTTCKMSSAIFSCGSYNLSRGNRNCFFGLERTTFPVKCTVIMRLGGIAQQCGIDCFPSRVHSNCLDCCQSRAHSNLQNVLCHF
jgi:hypothetical protein